MKCTFPLSCTEHANKSISNYFKSMSVSFQESNLLQGIKRLSKNLWALSVWRAEIPLMLQADAHQLQ